MMAFQPNHFIILPVGSWRPEYSSINVRMGPETVKSIVNFIACVAPSKGDVTVSFQGRDPLLADIAFYEEILRTLREKFRRRLHPRLRSNLWALDDRMITLIMEYEIAVSTDIETDQQICDAQRGKGYYARTRSAMNRLVDEGILVEEVCTLTPCFADAAGRIFGSFGDSPVAAKPYRIQGTVPMPNLPELGPALSTSEMTAVLTDTLMKYGSDIARRRVTNLDEMARGCYERKGVACTFSECLGHVAAIAPDGRIYPCDHLCGCDEFSMGSIFDNLGAEMIAQSAAYQKLLAVQEAAHAACGSCKHFDYCRGGCIANAIAAGTRQDPYCDTYHTTFDIMSRCIQWEQKALDAGKTTEKDAPLLAMAGVVPHPYDRLMNEMNMRLALRYARPERGGYLARRKGREFPENRYQNANVRMTMRGLTDDDMRNELEMPVSEAVETVREAAEARFCNVVVTGGEPLLYNDMDTLLDELARLDMTGTKLALHTSLGINIPETRLIKICAIFDAIVVNVEEDWTGAGHNGNRYDLMARQLERIQQMGYLDKVCLCAAFPEDMKNGLAGDAFLEYAQKLGIRKVRFIPSLSAEAKGTPPSSFALCTGDNEVDSLVQPRFTCGLGRSLSVEPDGGVYPCCACRGSGYLLGSVQQGLSAILNSDVFREYRFHDVDTNRKCRECGVRYLCGGMCKVWVKDGADIDSGDFDCTEKKACYAQIAAMIDM
jgi:uncharacterized protein